MLASFDPISVLRILDRRRVEYVIIGGFAGRLLGSPLMTEDLDICYSRVPSNLERLAGALEEMEARLRGAPEDLPLRLDAKTLAAGDHFTFKTVFGAFDVIGTPSGTGGFAALRGSARVLEVEGLKVPVASIEELIKMKLAAARPQDLYQAEVLGALRDEIEAQGDRLSSSED